MAKRIRDKHSFGPGWTESRRQHAVAHKPPSRERRTRDVDAFRSGLGGKAMLRADGWYARFFRSAPRPLFAWLQQRDELTGLIAGWNGRALYCIATDPDFLGYVHEDHLSMDDRDRIGSASRPAYDLVEVARKLDAREKAGQR